MGDLADDLARVGAVARLGDIIRALGARGGTEPTLDAADRKWFARLLLPLSELDGSSRSLVVGSGAPEPAANAILDVLIAECGELGAAALPARVEQIVQLWFRLTQNEQLSDEDWDLTRDVARSLRKQLLSVEPRGIEPNFGQSAVPAR